MISLVESEKRNPTLDTLLLIAEVLDIEFCVIIKKARTTALKN